MEARSVDPRVVRWLRSDPAYHVYFWDPPGTLCDEWELTGAADVHEVLAWAAANVKPGWTYSVHAVVLGDRDELGAIRLYGFDPA